MRFNPNSPLNLVWQEDFEPILAQLDAIVRSKSIPLNRHMVARALLALLKEGSNPTTQDVFSRVCEDMNSLPRGGPAGYDTEKWFGYVLKAVTILQSEQAVDVLR